MPEPSYKRVVVKMSGEGLQGDEASGISLNTLSFICEQIKSIWDLGVEVALVVGGGNIFRGGEKFSDFGLDRAVADYMGMLATVINGLALQNGLEKLGVPTRVMSALDIRQVAEPYIRRRAVRHMEKNRVVIFVAGTGSPYFTTDTAAALRAAEIHADLVIKATKVDGVYSEDPLQNPSAKFYEELTYSDVIAKKLKVMDITAITMCMENRIPIMVLNFSQPDNLKNAIMGNRVGTIIGAEDQGGK